MSSELRKDERSTARAPFKISLLRLLEWLAESVRLNRVKRHTNERCLAMVTASHFDDGTGCRDVGEAEVLGLSPAVFETDVNKLRRGERQPLPTTKSRIL